jgi:hypothetical protein
MIGPVVQRLREPDPGRSVSLEPPFTRPSQQALRQCFSLDTSRSRRDTLEPVWEYRYGEGRMRRDREGDVDESLEAREARLSEWADRKGYTLEKHGAGSPITKFDYSLVDKETFSIVIDSHDGLDRVEVFLNDLPEDR